MIVEVAAPVSFTVETTVLPFFVRQRDSRQNHLKGSAYALRGYGVTLGSSSSHDPFFSRPPARRPTGRRVAAAEGSMTVSGVQTAGVAWAVFRGEVPGCHSKPSVFDIWAMPENGPPIFQPPSGGR